MATSGIQLVAQNTAQINQGIQQVITSLKSLEQQMNKNNRQATLMDQIFGSSKGFKNFLSTISQVNTNQLKAFSSAVRQIVAAGNLASSGNLSNVSTQIVGLVNSINQVASVNTAALNNFTSSITSILSITPSKSNNFVQTITSLVNGIVKISAVASSASISNLSNIGSQISGFINAIAGSFSTKNTSALKNFASASNAIKGIASLLNALSGISKVNVKPEDIKKLVVVFTQLAAAFKISAFALKFVPGGKQLNELSKSLERIGFAFRAFKDLSGLDIDVEIVKRLAKSLVGIIASVRLVSRFSGSPANLQALAGALDAISKFFSNIAGANSTDVKQLKDFDTKMFLFVKALRHLRGIPKDIPNIGGIVNNVSQAQRANITNAGLKFQLGFIDAITFGFATRIGEALFNSFSKGVTDFLSGQSFRNLGDQLRNAGQELISKFGIDKIVRSSGFNLAAEFNDISNQFSVFAESLPLKEVQEFANQIGIKYPLSANEALQATLDLAKAGQGFGSIRNILPTAADLAAVAESKDINKATQFLIAAKGSFKEFADGVQANFDPQNIKIAANTVFAAANVSTASVDSMTEALARVGPAAAKMNLDLKTASAIITQFEDANIRGVEAGTLLRTTLAGFQTDKAQDELRRLGIAFINQDGTFRNIGTEIIPEIVQRYKDLGLTQVEVAQSIKQFGDVYAQQGLSILIARNATNQIITEMDKVIPVADAAQKMFKSFRGQVEQFRGSLETLFTKALSPLIDRFFTPLVAAGTQVINFFLSLDQSIIDTATNTIFLASAFATLSGTSLVLVGILVKMSGGVLGLTFAFARMLLQLPILIIQFGAFSVSLAASLAIITSFALAFVSAGAIITAAFKAVENDVGGARQSFENLRDTIFSVLGEIQRIAGTVFKGIGIFLNNLAGDGSAVKNVFGTISAALNNLLGFLKGIDTEAIAGFLFTAKRAADDLLGSLGNLVEGFFGLFSGDEFARDKITEGLTGIRDIINNIFAGIDLNKILPIGDIISTALRSIGIEIEDVIDIFEFAVNSIGQIIGLIGSFVTTIVADLSPLLNIFGLVGNAIGSVVKLIALLVNQEISIQTFAANIFATFSNLISNIFSNIGQTIANIGESIGSQFLTSIGNSIAKADFGKAIFTFLNELWSALYNAIRSIPDRLIELGGTLGSGLLRGIGIAIKTNDWNRVGVLIADGIRRAFENAIRLVVNLGLGLLNAIFPKDEVETLGSQAGRTLLDSIFRVLVGLIDPRTWAGILSGLASIVQEIVYQVATIPGNILREIGKQIENSFAGSILIAIGDIINLITQPIVYLSSILLRVASVVLSFIGSIVSLAEAINNASPAVKAGLLLIAGAILQIKFGLFTTAISSIISLIPTVIPLIVSLGNSFLALVPKIYAIAAPITAVVSGLILLKNVFNEAWRLFEGNILDFVVNVLGNFAFDILKIFGVDEETINRLRGGLQIWVGIFNFILERIVQIVREGIAKISIELNRVANRDTVEKVEQQVNIAFNEKSARETFQKISDIGTDALKNNDGKSLAALGDQMVANSSKIIQAWKDLIGSTEFKTLTDTEFKNAFSAVFSAGEGREAVRSLQGDTESLIRLFRLLDESQNPKAVDAIKESYGEFTQQLVDAELTTDQERQALQLLNQLVDGGKISAQAYNETINKVFGDMQEGTVVINENGDAVGQAKVKWEELDEAIKGVSETLGTTVSKEATLLKSFADNEIKQAQKLQDLYNRLFDAVDFGQIAREDADKYFDAVLQQMGIRRQSERDKLNPFRNNAFAGDGNKPFNLKDDPQYQEFLKQLQATPVEIPVEVGIPDTGPINQGIQIDPVDPQQVQEDSQEALEIRADYAKKEEDLLEGFAEREAKINEQITKDVQGYLREKQQAEENFNKDSIRREEDHQLALEKIDEQGSEQLLDAVANRDSAAAQAAVRNRNKQIKEEDSKFALDEKRRKEDFDREQANNFEKAQIRRQEQLDELIALQQERDLKLQELRTERDLELKKNQDLVAITQQGTAAQTQTLQGFFQNAIQGFANFGNSVLGSIYRLSPAVQPALSTLGSMVVGFANASFGGLGNTIANFVNSATNSVARAFSAIQNSPLGSLAQVGAQTVSNLGNSLGNLFNQAINNFQNQNRPTTQAGTTTNPVGNFLSNLFGGIGAGRASGGSMLPGRIHPVLERGEPEMAYSGGRYYAMMPQGGFVLPPKVAQNRSGGGGIYIHNDLSGMQVTGSNAMEIAEVIEGRVVSNISNSLKKIMGEK